MSTPNRSQHRAQSKSGRSPWRYALPTILLAVMILFSLGVAGSLAAPALDEGTSPTSDPVGAVRAVDPAASPTPVPPDASVEEMQWLEAVESAYKPDYVRLATGNPQAVPAWRAAELAQAMGVNPAASPTPVPPDASAEEMQWLEAVESAYKPDYVRLATGNPQAVPAWRAAELAQAMGVNAATHATYAWPFTVVQMGHAIQSYQNYSSGTSAAYFHHGIDIIAPNGTQVYNRSGGQVVNVENYQPGNDLYWEVAVLDPEGYIWQYHHIDKNTIPQAIKDAFAAYQANPTTGGFIAPDTYIGNIVYWPVTSFGYRFNHIHLNILGAGGAYMNGFEFHAPLADTVAPVLTTIGLLKNNTVTAGNTVSGDYGLYVRAKDLMMSPVYYLPPYKVEFSVDGGAVTTVWEFKDLPGGSDRYAYPNDYYVAPPTCGNYSCREFYVDLGFTTAGERVFPATNCSHAANVTVYDYNGNSTSGSFTWTVTGGLPVTLSVSKTGSGSGTVSSPAGIDCGATCSATYDGCTTSVTLTADPATGSIFTGWSGACTDSGACSVTMNGDRTVTATFVPMV